MAEQTLNKVLFLDDMEWRHDTFLRLALRQGDVQVTQVWDAARAISALGDRCDFGQVYLDHDLSEADILIGVGEAGSVPTGMTVVDHILTMTSPPLHVIVHSCNGPAAAEMARRLKGHPSGIKVDVMPFPWLATAIDTALESKGL